jgi:hypothetical protein
MNSLEKLQGLPMILAEMADRAERSEPSMALLLRMAGQVAAGMIEGAPFQSGAIVDRSLAEACGFLGSLRSDDAPELDLRHTPGGGGGWVLCERGSSIAVNLAGLLHPAGSRLPAPPALHQQDPGGGSDGVREVDLPQDARTE